MTYEELIEQLAIEGLVLDLGYQSALFLLGGLMPDSRITNAIEIETNTIAAWRSTETLRQISGLRINWPELDQDASFSSGERVVIDTAYSLFRGGPGPGLGDITTTLEDRLIDRALEAARLRASLPLHLSIST